MPAENELNCRSTLLRILPKWLHNGNIGRVVYAIGLHLDALGDSCVAAVRKQAPEADSEDASALIQANRNIIRGREETWAGYCARVKTWRQAHRIRGGPYALLRQINAYWLGAFAVELRYSGVDRTQFQMSPEGEIARLIGSYAPPTPGWAQWLLIYYWPTAIPGPAAWGDAITWGEGAVWGSGLTPTEVADLRRVPAQWGNAHTRGRLRLAYAANPTQYVEISVK